jgi:hypothetical protein
MVNAIFELRAQSCLQIFNVEMSIRALVEITGGTQHEYITNLCVPNAWTIKMIK